MHEQRGLLPEAQATEIVVHTAGGAPIGSSPDTMRELLGALFRNQRVFRSIFVLTFGGAILALFLFGIKYEADTQILVKHRRADEVVSTDTSSREQETSTGVPVRDIAEAIGRGLNVPVESITPAEAAGHFGWLGAFVGMDLPASSVQTRHKLGWNPTGPTLLTDLGNMRYSCSSSKIGCRSRR
jgi:hypothetical protein